MNSHFNLYQRASFINSPSFAERTAFVLEAVPPPDWLETWRVVAATTVAVAASKRTLGCLEAISMSRENCA